MLQFLKEQLQELPAVDWAQFQKLAVTQQLLHLAEPRLRQLPLSRPLQKVLEYARLTYFTTLRHNLAVDNLAVQVAIFFQRRPADAAVSWNAVRASVLRRCGVAGNPWY